MRESMTDHCTDHATDTPTQGNQCDVRKMISDAILFPPPLQAYFS